MTICTCSQQSTYLGCTLHTPETYLSDFRFHRRLRCPRSNLQVTYSDVGDPRGPVTLVVLPSCCSRLVVAGLEPICREWGIRIVCVDRGGCGGTENVKMDQRIQVSTDQTISVLEHLNVVPKSLIAASGGIYYALHLLSIYPSNLLLPSPNSPSKSKLPSLYLLAPWSPILSSLGMPSISGMGFDGYFQPLALIPSALIKAQHLILPSLMPIINTLSIPFAASSSLFSRATSIPNHAPTVSSKEKEDAKRKEFPYGKYWKKGGKNIIGEWIMTENIQGLGQEYLLCLSRGIDTGPKWFESKLEEVGKRVREVAGFPTAVTETDVKFNKDMSLVIDCWWGDKDGMVPIKGQEWLNKMFASKEEIECTVCNIKGGTHNDLIDRSSAFGAILERIGTRPLDVDEDGVQDGVRESCDREYVDREDSENVTSTEGF